MAKPIEPEKKKEAEAEGDAEARGSRGRWLFGWVIVPGSLLGMLFLAGVHVGANHPDMWLSRLISWIGS